MVKLYSSGSTKSSKNETSKKKGDKIDLLQQLIDELLQGKKFSM